LCNIGCKWLILRPEELPPHFSKQNFALYTGKTIRFFTKSTHTMGLFNFLKGKPKLPETGKQKSATKAGAGLPENEAEITPKTGETLATIMLNSQTFRVLVPAGDTILNACLGNGLDAPFMCEAGVCTTCRATLLQGKVTMMACYGLNDEEVKKGYILTCQSLPQTAEIAISYD